MREKDVQAIFGKVNTLQGVFELKLVKDKGGKFPPLPFQNVADHQRASLHACCNGVGLYHKISDSFIGDKSGQRRFPSAKPFDCFFLQHVHAFVVICYYIPRISKEFVYIPIEDFLDEAQKSDRKSLTYDRALEIGWAIYDQTGLRML